MINMKHKKYYYKNKEINSFDFELIKAIKEFFKLNYYVLETENKIILY